MVGHDNNFFGWSFILGAIGSVALLVASSLFFVDANIYNRKKNQFRESQAVFELQISKS